MRLVLFAVFLLSCDSALSVAAQTPAPAQSCLTPADVKAMTARADQQSGGVFDKKLQTELVKLVQKHRELLLKVVDEDQKKESTREKLHDYNVTAAAKLCEILKANGWPTAALVDRAGVTAAFYILKNSGTFELQRDLLPVIVAAVKKDPAQKPEFAGIYDRLRVSAGMKQLFGTQAVSIGGFLVLYPIEDEAHIDDRRQEFGLTTMAANIRHLESTFHKPLIKSRQAPDSSLSKQQKDSLTKAIDSANLGGEYVDPEDVIKTETNLVSLNVSVFNEKQKAFVGSLTKDDFRVLEDGREQTVSYFASTDVPFDLVLLVDLSGSTSDKRDLIRKSTLRFIEAARPNDRLAIVTFADNTDVVSPLTLDRQALTASVKGMEGLGGSHIWDALKFTMDEVLGSPTLERRRAIVLMTDGLDGALFYPGPSNGSLISFADLVEMVRQTDTLIVPIYLDTENEAPTGMPRVKDLYENARKTLSVLAQESGGSFYRARKLSDLNGVYEQVINDLGKVYSLGYKPTNEKRDRSWRFVKISIPNRPELITRARPGYYAK
jgi:VWFA-related protein